jgi:hypothetical protein
VCIQVDGFLVCYHGVKWASGLLFVLAFTLNNTDGWNDTTSINQGKVSTNGTEKGMESHVFISGLYQLK